MFNGKKNLLLVGCDGLLLWDVSGKATPRFFVICEVCANQRLHWAHTTLCSYLRLTKYHIPTAFQKPLQTIHTQTADRH